MSGKTNKQEAGQARELPPLPECLILDGYHAQDVEGGAVDGFTAEQMQEYAMAAQAAPAVPQEWREFVENCSKTAGGMVSGNTLSMLAGRLLAATPSAPSLKNKK